MHHLYLVSFETMANKAHQSYLCPEFYPIIHKFARGRFSELRTRTLRVGGLSRFSEYPLEGNETEP